MLLGARAGSAGRHVWLSYATGRMLSHANGSWPYRSRNGPARDPLRQERRRPHRLPGDGAGPLDLVFVHGFISTSRSTGRTRARAPATRRPRSPADPLRQARHRPLRPGRPALPSLETRADDVRAVMEATGCGRAALIGASEGGPLSLLFAATFPDRVARAGPVRRLCALPPLGRRPARRWSASSPRSAASWGTGETLRHFAPGLLGDRISAPGGRASSGSRPARPRRSRWRG